MFVTDTPIIDNLADFGAQREQIEVGMRATEALAAWFKTQRDKCQTWAEHVATLSANMREDL